MKTIKELNQEIFSINYKHDFQDDSIMNLYIEKAKKLIDDNNWSDIYECWYQYLINECKDEESILNFANLFWCYGGADHCVYNAIELVAYFVAYSDRKKHPEWYPLLDGISRDLFKNSGIITNEDIIERDYYVLSDPRIWKEVKRIKGE